MSKQIEIKDLVKKVLGHISFAGESNHDDKSLENLHDYFELIEELVNDISELARIRFQYQASAQSLGNKAYEWLGYLRDEINIILNLVKEDETEDNPSPF